MAYTCIAVRGTPLWWPLKPVGASLDYSLDVSQAIDPANDFIETVSVAAAPSGDGELAIDDLIVDDNLLTLTCGLGVASRVYTINFTITMTDGRVFNFLVNQGVSPVLPGYPVPVAPAPGYGDSLVYTYAASLDFSNALNSGYAPLIGSL